MSICSRAAVIVFGKEQASYVKKKNNNNHKDLRMQKSPSLWKEVPTWDPSVAYRCKYGVTKTGYVVDSTKEGSRNEKKVTAFTRACVEAGTCERAKQLLSGPRTAKNSVGKGKTACTRHPPLF